MCPEMARQKHILCVGGGRGMGWMMVETISKVHLVEKALCRVNTVNVIFIVVRFPSKEVTTCDTHKHEMRFEQRDIL